jgi:hypothetical protein
MYSPYATSTQKNKYRLYLVLFLLFLGIIVYWKYSSPQKSKQRFQSAGEHIDGAIQQGKDTVNHLVDNVKDKVDNVVDAAKDKAKKAADTVEQAAADAKKKL